MAKSTAELFEEKLALVYEYNKNSPLFVRAASLEISRGNLPGALKVLVSGIQQYPDYSTAYILLGKVQMLAGNYDQAEEAFRKASFLIGSKETLNFYITELETVRKKNSQFTESRRVAFFPEEMKGLYGGEEAPKQSAAAGSQSSANDTAFQETIDTQATGSSNKDNAKADEENLDELAQRISSAKMKITSHNELGETDDALLPETEDKSMPPEGDSMISETLAKIYMSQGKFNEAIEVYKQLIKKTPAKAEIYMKIINDIQSQLDGFAW